VLRDDGTRGLSRVVIGVAIAIHKRYGPGLLESTYRDCLVWDLRQLRCDVQCDRPLTLEHGGATIHRAYRPDLVIDGTLIVEVKSVERLAAVHLQQLRTYLRLSGIGAGLLINFNVPILRHGIRRALL
jgi:GxxExxY protein